MFNPISPTNSGGEAAMYINTRNYTEGNSIKGKVKEKIGPIYIKEY